MSTRNRDLSRLRCANSLREIDFNCKSSLLAASEPTAEPALRLRRAVLNILVELVHCGRELGASVLARLLELLLRVGTVAVDLRVGFLDLRFCVRPLQSPHQLLVRVRRYQYSGTMDQTYSPISLLAQLLAVHLNLLFCLLLCPWQLGFDF